MFVRIVGKADGRKAQPLLQIVVDIMLIYNVVIVTREITGATGKGNDFLSIAVSLRLSPSVLPPSPAPLLCRDDMIIMRFLICR